MKIKAFFMAIAVLALIALGLLLLTGRAEKYEVIFETKNIKSLKLYELKGSEAEASQTLIQAGGPDLRIKLPVSRNYRVAYLGESGYESGDVRFVPDKNKTIKISPKYSPEKLEEILQAELSSILDSIVARYPQLTRLYDISPGKLYGFGDWYGTSLKYKGSDIYNYDPLKIILHKENGLWKVKTEPPDIYLSGFRYPEIPRYVLSDVNNRL